MKLSFSQLSSGTDPGWIGSAWARMRNSSLGGILGALQNRGDGSISSAIGQASSGANAFATIAQSRVSGSSSLVAQMAGQHLREQQMKKLQESLDGLNSEQQMVQANNVLDPYVYFENGSSLDTENNIMTMSDGTKIDTITGAQYVDPASIVQMGNGSYLNTSTNILTMPDGTKIDTVTGLTVV